MREDEDTFVIHGVPLPAKVGPFVRARQVRNYESDCVGLGQSIAYKREDGPTATIYIYDLSIPNVPSSIADPIVVNQFSNEIGVLFQFHRGNNKVKLWERSVLEGRNGAPDFLFAALQIVSESAYNISFLFLTTRNGKFVKIRVTHDANLSDDKLEQCFAATIDFVKVFGFLILDHEKSVH